MENSAGWSLMLGSAANPRGQDPPSPDGPFQCLFPSSPDSSSSFSMGSQGTSKAAAAELADVHHQRASSDSFLIEQPSWLDELLNEPDVPTRRTHRRSSSDSIAYMGTVAQAFRKEDRKLKSLCVAGPSWEFQDNLWQNSFNTNVNYFDEKQNGANESNQTSVMSVHSIPSSGVGETSGSSIPQESLTIPSKSNARCSSVKNDGSSANTSAPRIDSKRAKQQFAQRSRLRKLQYIADLERNVLILQAEGYEVSSALKYLDQQIVLLVTENQALRQRMDSLSQEHVVKYLEKEMLERELARLQFVYQQQQQQKQRHKHTHNRSKAREVQFRLANLSI